MSYYYSDLHIHSKYSRATSKLLDYTHLTFWGSIKGLNLIGTGDILHKKWQEEFSDSLIYDNTTGFYKPNQKTLKQVQSLHESVNIQNKNILDNPPFFIPTVETSHIYKHNNKVRKIHLVTIFDTLESAKKISNYLESNDFNLHSDGRPILGLPVKSYLQILLERLDSSQFILMPAHIWTPWFSLLGAKSGYNSISEAFEDLSSYITVVETGLSSDPKMNRHIAELDTTLLLSNSDAHSPQKLAREANIHIKLNNINTLFNTFKTQKNFYGTIEFYPEEGKYYYSGHRKCNIAINPLQNKQLTHCPVCKKPLTKGVLHRVSELSTRTKPNKKLLDKFPTIYSIPLVTLLSKTYKKGESSKTIQQKYFETINTLGPEINILHNININSIANYDKLLATTIQKLRNHKIKVTPGYDGIFGQISI